MALNDREHIEAVAIIRHLLEDVGHSHDLRAAAYHWLAKNHPTPDTYLNGLNQSIEELIESAETDEEIK